jgi:hypothetical protein
MNTLVGGLLATAWRLLFYSLEIKKIQSAPSNLDLEAYNDTQLAMPIELLFLLYKNK